MAPDRPDDPSVETEAEDRLLTEDELVDEAGRQSFPASDPPAY